MRLFALTVGLIGLELRVGVGMEDLKTYGILFTASQIIGGLVSY